MALNTFLGATEMLENITKRMDRCNKRFHDFINVIHHVNEAEGYGATEDYF
jgi:hypothetical protein